MMMFVGKFTRLRPKNILFAVIVISLVSATVIVDDYGINPDTLGVFEYGKLSLNAYSLRMISEPLLVKDMLKVIDTPILRHPITNLKYYGPAFHMVPHLISKILEYLGYPIDLVLVQKFLIFTMFLVSEWCLFVLCQRYMNDWYALIVALAFFSQPLLFGHSFINSKDIPFMSLFIASVVIGFKMIDHTCSQRVREGKEGIEKANFLKLLVSDTRALDYKEKKKIGLITACWLGIIITIILSINILDDLVTNLVMTMYRAEPSSLWGRLFSAVASDYSSIPVDLYISKSLLLFHRILTYGLFLISSLMILLFIRRLPNLTKLLSDYFRKFPNEVIPFLKNTLSYLKNRHILYAGIILGLTISTRNIGLAAGGIIIVLLLHKLREKAVTIGISYLSITTLTTIATWPFLWHDPWGVFVTSIKHMAQHPWDGKILYNGILYGSNELPISYLPKLIAFQFTIPIIVLSILGFVIFLYRRKMYSRNKELGLIALWFIIPLTYVIVAQPTVYHNFRQFLFIAPPLFVFTGIMLSWIGEKIKYQWLLILLALVVVVPGFIGVIDLHPFQYIYYNEFIGGVDGASRKYLTDYWDTSFKDAMSYLNEHAEESSKILVWGGAVDIVRFYAREDFDISRKTRLVTSLDGYDYILFSTYLYRADLYNALDAEIAYQVAIRDVVLSVVKKLN